MFLHHTMTDSEILRSCEGCTSQHLRLVADRLRDRVETLERIRDTATIAFTLFDVERIKGLLHEIIDESTPGGN
jgi:primosomal protein N'